MIDCKAIPPEGALLDVGFIVSGGDGLDDAYGMRVLSVEDDEGRTCKKEDEYGKKQT